MKGKRRNKRPIAPRPAVKEEAQGLYFRLCHLCLHLNESDQPIIKCSRCESQMTLEFEAENEINGLEFVNPLEEWDGEGDGEDFPDEEALLKAHQAKEAAEDSDDEFIDEESTLSGVRRRLAIRLNGLRVRW